MYECESWTIKKAECWRTDAFGLWCWRRLLRVPWTARRSNQSILKEISPEYSLEGLVLKLKFRSFGHLVWKLDSLEKTLMLGKLEGRRRRGLTIPFSSQSSIPLYVSCGPAIPNSSPFIPKSEFLLLQRSLLMLWLHWCYSLCLECPSLSPHWSDSYSFFLQYSAWEVFPDLLGCCWSLSSLWHFLLTCIRPLTTLHGNYQVAFLVFSQTVSSLWQ